jgi:ABC-type antimicrobial peptide transport system permease subunit
MSYTVSRRSSEIGIRIALGAQRSRVIAMVLRDVGRILSAGVVLGGLLSLGTTRLISKFLFGMQANDPLTLVVSACVLVAVAMSAAMLPARRAARVDPVAALRD